MSRPSWGCRGLLSGFSVLSRGLVWKVGSGARVRILEDSWVPGGPVHFKDQPSEAATPSLVSSLLIRVLTRGMLQLFIAFLILILQ